MRARGHAVGAGVTVVPVPYSQDNYAYLVINDRTRMAQAHTHARACTRPDGDGGRWWARSAGEAVVVDAGDADAVQAAVQAAGAKLVAVLSTHRHWYADLTRGCACSNCSDGSSNRAWARQGPHGRQRCAGRTRPQPGHLRQHAGPNRRPDAPRRRRRDCRGAWACCSQDTPSQAPTRFVPAGIGVGRAGGGPRV